MLSSPGVEWLLQRGGESCRRYVLFLNSTKFEKQLDPLILKKVFWKRTNHMNSIQKYPLISRHLETREVFLHAIHVDVLGEHQIPVAWGHWGVTWDRFAPSESFVAPWSVWSWFLARGLHIFHLRGFRVDSMKHRFRLGNYDLVDLSPSKQSFPLSKSLRFFSHGARLICRSAVVRLCWALIFLEASYGWELCVVPVFLV